MKTLKFSLICPGYKYVLILSIVLSIYIYLYRYLDIYIAMIILLAISLIASFLSDRKSLEQYKNVLMIIGVKQSEVRRYIMFFGIPRTILLFIPLTIYIPRTWLFVVAVLVLLFTLYISSILMVKR